MADPLAIRFFRGSKILKCMKTRRVSLLYFTEYYVYNTTTLHVPFIYYLTKSSGTTRYESIPGDMALEILAFEFLVVPESIELSL